MKTYLYRASNLKSTITFMASVSWQKSFLATAKNRLAISESAVALSM